MNEIIRAVYASHFSKLKIRINKFKSKFTDEIRFAVMQVNNHHQVYDASEWEMQEDYEVENTEMIQQVFNEEIIKQIEGDKK